MFHGIQSAGIQTVGERVIDQPARHAERAALILVARGAAPLGVVYASDAKAEPSVKVVATFPPDSHPPIIYPFAPTMTTKGNAFSR
jgi:ABC-type molybdate transport system substrate-binding protein